MNERFRIYETDRVLAVSELHFDLSVYDIFGILGAGGCVVLPPTEFTREPSEWFKLVNQHSVTLWNSVPALFQMFLEYLSFHSELLPPSLKQVWLSGDRIPEWLPKRLSESGGKLVCLGGATEASIWSICYEPVAPFEKVLYGKPLSNQKMFVLNSFLEICQSYVQGEIFIGGVGLAVGYHGDESKTKDSFIKHPKTGERLYRTGDFGRYLPDCNIKFLGRKDDQIKLNGYRIELGEVRSVLLQHESVQDAIVILTKNQITAFVIHAKEIESSIDLQTFTSLKLPKYMLPSSIVSVESFPLTTNGKVDSMQLEKMAGQYFCNSVTDEKLRVTPFNSFEEELMSLWSKVLGVCSTPLNSPFFNSSGSSLEALKLAMLINELFSTNVSVAWVYEHQTIADQGKQLAILKSNTDEQRNDYIHFNKKGTKGPIILIHPGRDSAYAYSQLAKELGENQPVVAIEYYNLFTKTEMDQTVEKMATRYISTILHTDLCPPYILGGWSFGGLVAYEMAKQLKLRGIVVDKVFMFDTPFPMVNKLNETYNEKYDILSVISEPEKQLFISLNKNLKKKYVESAIRELQAINDYSILNPTKLEELEIVQFLPTESEPQFYSDWANCAGSYVTEDISGSHSSILRNEGHREVLVSKIKIHTEIIQNIIFVLIGSNIDFGQLKQKLANDILIVFVSEDASSENLKQLEQVFDKICTIPKGRSIGYLDSLDFESCKNEMTSCLIQFSNEKIRKNTFIISADEGNSEIAGSLRDSFGISNGPSYKQIQNFRHKSVMKQVLAKGGIKVPMSYPISSPKEGSKIPLEFPFLIKPVNSGGGFGVYQINNETQLEEIWAKLDLSLEYAAEELIVGELYHCDIALSAFDQNNPVFADAALYFQSYMGADSKHDCIGSWTVVDKDVKEEIIKFCQKAVQHLGGNCGLYHCEIFRNVCTGELTFLEVGARVPGALIPKMYEKTRGVNLLELHVLLQSHQRLEHCQYQNEQNRLVLGIWALFFAYGKGQISSFNKLNFKGIGCDLKEMYKPGDEYDEQKAIYKLVGTMVAVTNDKFNMQKLAKSLRNFRLVNIIPK